MAGYLVWELVLDMHHPSLGQWRLLFIVYVLFNAREGVLYVDMIKRECVK